MKNYINGILYGIKISIKLMAKLNDIKQGITILCNLRSTLLKKDFKSNIEIWQYVQFEVFKNNWNT